MHRCFTLYGKTFHNFKLWIIHYTYEFHNPAVVAKDAFPVIFYLKKRQHEALHYENVDGCASKRGYCKKSLCMEYVLVEVLGLRGSIDERCITSIL
ncbi:hypothetical protein Acr_08g0017210 [Actinidia rufa]|uniref:Uncharacterized protein n=1 Tax=Actinidia rufa TaxID=165716 RepID=A0A7J0F3Q9_9ERIC|nr:hypothetical protein Acr_08g0017210 [Actinidia rufa]